MLKSILKWLENDSESVIYTLSDLHNQMTAMSGGIEVYSIKRMKQRLQEHYDEYVFFADVGQGKKEVVCFRNMANYIVNEIWLVGKSGDSEEKAGRIVASAAKII